MENHKGVSRQETSQSASEVASLGYHTRRIAKGKLGEISKIREELEELEDADLQGARVLVLCELADLVGAVSHYVEKHFPTVNLGDLIKMVQLTERAFKNGER